MKALSVKWLGDVKRIIAYGRARCKVFAAVEVSGLLTLVEEG